MAFRVPFFRVPFPSAFFCSRPECLFLRHSEARVPFLAAFRCTSAFSCRLDYGNSALHTCPFYGNLGRPFNGGWGGYRYVARVVFYIVQATTMQERQLQAIFTHTTQTGNMPSAPVQGACVEPQSHAGAVAVAAKPVTVRH